MNGEWDMRLSAVCVMLAALLYSCATISQKGSMTVVPAEVLAARQALEALETRNSELKSFKGLGTLRLKEGSDPVQSFRVAWAGAADDRLRMDVMGPSGKPVARIAIDGRHLYFQSTYPFEKHRKRLTDRSLKYLTSVPVRISDLQAFMRGRIPVRRHHQARLSIENTSKEPVLTLKSRWGGTVERIYLDPSTETVLRMEFFSNSGRSGYRAHLEAPRQFGSWTIPSRMVFESLNQDGGRLELTVDRLWPNVRVPDSLFKLSHRYPEYILDPSPQGFAQN